MSRINTWPDFRFNLEECSGAVGDFGTLFPIILGVALVSDVNPGLIVLWFSIWYIVTGICYRMPIPVEPMKAVGAIVIAEELGSREIAASGIILGILFLVLGYFKCMKYRMTRANLIAARDNKAVFVSDTAKSV